MTSDGAAPGLGIVVSFVAYACYRHITMALNNAGIPMDERIEDLVRQMTLDEKISLLSGVNWMDTPAIERLGIPAIKMNDGPLGVRYWSIDARTSPESFGTTAFPAGIAMAATWDAALVEREGRAIAEQVKALGRNMLLGPTVNISRVPQWGRNFEGYGEDPYLASRMAVAYVRGVKSEGVIATVKHFAANNQEEERYRVDVQVSERALQEIYFPAFRAAVLEGEAGAVMSAYNKVNGHWCAENAQLLIGVLRSQWGFRGIVVSDWASTHTTAKTIRAGLDIEMPGGSGLEDFRKQVDFGALGFDGGFLTLDRVTAAIESGELSRSVIDDRVRHILWALATHGLLDRTEVAPTLVVDTPSHRALARQAAVASMVLLKNDREVLPLDPRQIRSLAVVGPNAGIARTGGGGSALVIPKMKPQSPLEALRERAGAELHVEYALGCAMEGEPEYSASPESRERHLREAVELARRVDAAIVFVGFSPRNETECQDRTFELPSGQDELISAVAAANPKTIIVLNAGGPVAMGRWIAQVQSVLLAWYPGQAAGPAIAALLFGDENPSGKLPVTFPRVWEDSPAYGNYPGTELRVNYAEGIYVGYRHFDKRQVAPLYAFGHGLSYTTFDYCDLEVLPASIHEGKSVTVSLKVRNSGQRAGAEVVELYVRDVDSTVDRPMRELKGFARIELDPGEVATVTFELGAAALAFYDEQSKAWVVEPGRFEIHVGASSRDLRLSGNFEYLPRDGGGKKPLP